MEGEDTGGGATLPGAPHLADRVIMEKVSEQEELYPALIYYQYSNLG